MSIIIIGAGQIGQFIATKLAAENKDVIVIDEDESKIASLGKELDVKVLHGNGTSPTVLREANIKEAQMVIAVTDSDEVNLLSCTVADQLAAAPITVARVRNPDFYHPHDEETLKKLNIDLMINPDKEAADNILGILSVPGAVDVMDFFGGRMKLVGVRVGCKTEITGELLENLHLSSNGKHILLSAIIRDKETMIPTGKNRILAGDTIYFVTEPDNTKNAMKLFGIEMKPIEKVMIYGGSFIGLYLAKFLEKKDIQVKMIEPNPGLCSKLVRNLDKCAVLNDTATNQEFLVQENVGDMNAFIAVTDDDENNVLSALLAKSLGCKWVIALTNKADYFPLVTTIGVDVAVSPRLIANGKILHFVRQGKVLSVSPIHEDIEILEFEALETSDIVNIPIKNAKLPKESIILSIERGGKIIIPHGETVIIPRDKILIESSTKAIPKIEKLFTVKLEYF